ncbi:hypothetical protein [Rodentibacter ratti]|uniref:hypothetical protein n=1 Tax=Rodentibacter ratti TaxID=1906745 RepID=UPI0026C683E8|nr:hypothetical protein [Rodentibacter ratti]
MEKSLWPATAYMQEAHQLEQFVALAAFVQTREEFEQRVQTHFSQQPAHFRFQLAPIPANLFFQRHGKTWLLHQAATLGEQEIREFPLMMKPHSPSLKKILTICIAISLTMSSPLVCSLTVCRRSLLLSRLHSFYGRISQFLLI